VKLSNRKNLLPWAMLLKCSYDAGQPDLRFEEGMRREHCSKQGYDHHFTTSNYQIQTFPKNEWQIVVDKREDLADMSHGRQLVDISILMKLEMVIKANLTRQEVIAIVLYTGPMVRVS
jgi:hypothetical protein